MKQTDFNLKTLFTLFLASFLLAGSAFSQPRIPVIVNWDWHDMDNQTGEMCIDLITDKTLVTRFKVLCNDPPANSNEDPMWVYAKLPGMAVGEYKRVVSFEDPEEPVPGCPDMKVGVVEFDSDLTELCNNSHGPSFCATVDWQLVTLTGNGLIYCPYPIADNPGLFPPNCFEEPLPEFAVHWSETKMICCDEPGTTSTPTDCNSDGPFLSEGPHECAVVGTPEGEGEMQLVSNQATSTQSASVHRLGKEMGEKSAKSPKVFPNPFYASVTIDFSMEKAGKATFEWMDLNGRIISFSENYYTAEGNYRERFEMADWATGTYFVRISTATDSHIFKVNKMNH